MAVKGTSNPSVQRKGYYKYPLPSHSP